jgi:hypothetical protein
MKKIENGWLLFLGIIGFLILCAVFFIENQYKKFKNPEKSVPKKEKKYF